MKDGYPSHEPYQLSEAEHQHIFERRILRAYRHIESVPNPTVHFFGAQPGAGKTRVENVVRDRLAAKDGPNTIMPIIGDDYRSYHLSSSTSCTPTMRRRQLILRMRPFAGWKRRSITRSRFSRTCSSRER